MQMAEEQMTDVALPDDRVGERPRIEQRDVVHALQPHLERWMVHEDHHWPVAGLVERALEPGATRRAEAAPRLAGLVGVEADRSHTLAHLERVLDEAIGIDRRRR